LGKQGGGNGQEFYEMVAKTEIEAIVTALN
jgi:hypothetical protein